jgi:4-amino-4-deoxy-L-arabinose transferase-like glycosyltransferase
VAQREPRHLRPLAGDPRELLAELPPAAARRVTGLSPRAAGALVFAVALVLRAGWVATLEERLAWPDEAEYVAIGRRLAAGDGFVASSYRSAPVLPAYLGVAFRLFGDGLLAPRLGQALAGALACVLVVRLGTGLLGPAVGTLAGALLAVYPAHVYLAGVFYPTALETLGAALAVTLAARVLRGRAGAGGAALAGVALGLTVLTRPVWAALVPCIGAVWLAAAPPPRRRAALACAAFLCAAAATVLPWSARNHAVYGRFVLVSSGGGTTLWKGNNELADGTADDRFLGWERPVWIARRARLPAAARAALDAKYAAVRERVAAREAEVGDSYLALDDVLGAVAHEHVAAAPGAALRRAARRVATFFSAFSPTSTRGLARPGAVLAAASFYPALALAALAPALAPGCAARLLLPYAVVLTMTAAHAALTSCTRFRLPLDPYVLLGAACALVALRARWAARAR